MGEVELNTSLIDMYTILPVLVILGLCVRLFYIFTKFIHTKSFAELLPPNSNSLSAN
jgi:hypothetical protein